MAAVALTSWVMRRAAVALMPAAAAVLIMCGAVTMAAAEDIPLMACARGRPHYCLKYGQGQCPKKNSAPNAAYACEQWTQACIECQTAIAYCFERTPERILEGSAECTACHAELNACMKSIDKEYWPNR